MNRAPLLAQHIFRQTIEISKHFTPALLRPRQFWQVKCNRLLCYTGSGQGVGLGEQLPEVSGLLRGDCTGGKRAEYAGGEAQAERFWLFAKGYSRQGGNGPGVEQIAGQVCAGCDAQLRQGSTPGSEVGIKVKAASRFGAGDVQFAQCLIQGVGNVAVDAR